MMETFKSGSDKLSLVRRWWALNKMNQTFVKFLMIIQIYIRKSLHACILFVYNFSVHCQNIEICQLFYSFFRTLCSANMFVFLYFALVSKRKIPCQHLQSVIFFYFFLGSCPVHWLQHNIVWYQSGKVILYTLLWPNNYLILSKIFGNFFSSNIFK